MEKKSNYNKRKDLSYAPYTNGVVDENGEQVIRPLTSEEKEFLDKFNKEFVNASFNNDETDLHYKLIKANASKVATLKKEFKRISKEVRKWDNGYREMNGQERADYKEYRKALFIKKNQILEELEKVDYKKVIEASNYNRGVDISNSSRTTRVGDLASGNFVFDENINNKRCSESELFDRLKNPPLTED